MKVRKDNLIDRISRISGWLGLLTALIALMVHEIQPAFRPYTTAALILSTGLLVFFFIIHFESLKNLSAKRSARHGANSALMVVIIAGILGILNFLSAQHHTMVDLSETQRFTLAPQSFQILQNLDREVRIIAFVSDQGRSKPAIRDLLNNFRYTNPMVSFSFVDPDKKPSVTKQYGITQYDTLVFESGNQSAQIKVVNEQEITNAIIRVSRDAKRKILFVTGHGEHSLNDAERNGYTLVKENLEKQGFEVGEISLLQEARVPEDTSLLVIAGPQRPYLPEEVRVLTDFLDSPGKILLLADPNERSGLNPLLSEWGVTFQGGVIIDTLSRLFGGDFTIPVVNSYPDHEVTKGFNLATFFPLAQGIEFDTSRAAEYDFTPLAQTSGNSWAKLRIPEDGQIRFNPGEDKKGPLTIGATLSRKPKTGDSPSTPLEEQDRPVLTIFGDSDFASNSSFHFSGNGDLFMNTVSWMAEEKNLISIRPKENSFSPLFLSRTQGRILMYSSLIIIPSAILIAGFTVWKRRRRL